MTENKGKEPSRSDNVVYDYSSELPADFWSDEREWTMAIFGSLSYCQAVAAYAQQIRNQFPTSNPSPISASDANLTPADAILRDDEK